MSQISLPSLEHLRSMTSPPSAPPFHVGIVIGPGYIPMDIVGVQTILSLLPGAQIHLLWKSEELVEGFPNWWTRPTTTFRDAPETLDVLAVPMLAPETQNDPELVAFIADKGKTARFVVGICMGVLALGAAGLLKGRRVTASHNALPMLDDLGAAETVAPGSGVVVDGNLYTAGPGVGSFEASFLVAEAAFGRTAAEFAEVVVEYDPHPVFGMGVPKHAPPALVAQFEALVAPLTAEYRKGSVGAYRAAAPS